MFGYSWPVAKRFAVLVPGIVIAYFSVRDVFPYFNKWLPKGFAILVTYIIGAYILVPAIIRSWRVLKPAKHVPLYCVTPDGFASDPLNIGVIATRLQLIQAMEKAGWYVADAHTARNLARNALSTILGITYTNAPVSNLYLFGRKQDIAFEIPLAETPGHRHHVRFWATTYEGKQKLTIRSIHWHNRRSHIAGDKLLWVGAASLDTGFGVIRHNLQLTHMIAPDTNDERELIVQQLRAQKLVQNVSSIKLGKPYKLINRVLRGSLHTDGHMAVVTLRRAKPYK